MSAKSAGRLTRGDADTVNDRVPPALTQIAVVVADTSAHA